MYITYVEITCTANTLHWGFPSILPHCQFAKRCIVLPSCVFHCKKYCFSRQLALIQLKLLQEIFFCETHGVRVLIAKTRGHMCVGFVTVGVRRCFERFREVPGNPVFTLSVSVSVYLLARKLKPTFNISQCISRPQKLTFLNSSAIRNTVDEIFTDFNPRSVCSENFITIERG